MTSEVDRYGAPRVELNAPTEATFDLASRGSRLLAAILDSILATLFMAPAVIALGVFDGFPNIEPVSRTLQLQLAVAGFAGYLLLHSYLLYTQSQTVGKWLVGVRIVGLDGSRASFGVIVGLRVLPVSIASQIPLIGQLLTLIDVLFIFGADRRCLHDRIAETVVVRVRA